MLDLLLMWIGHYEQILVHLVHLPLSTLVVLIANYVAVHVDDIVTKLLALILFHLGKILLRCLLRRCCGRGPHGL